MDGKLDTSKKCAPSAQKVNHTLGCIKRSVASRVREVILLCAYETPPGVLCPDVESSVKEICGPVGAHSEEAQRTMVLN